MELPAQRTIIFVEKSNFTNAKSFKNQSEHFPLGTLSLNVIIRFPFYFLDNLVAHILVISDQFQNCCKHQDKIIKEIEMTTNRRPICKLLTSIK